MRTINEVIATNNLSTRSGIAAKTELKIPQKPTSSISTSAEKHSKRIDRLFLRFAAMYGHVWKSLYKSDEFLAFTKQEWRDALTRFDDDVIAKALTHSQCHWAYPPTLPQFIECCKAHSNNVFVMHPHTPSRNFEVAHAALNKIRTILNMKSR